MGKEEIVCVLCKTYSHPVLSVTAIMSPLPFVCLWRVVQVSAHGSLYCVLGTGYWVLGTGYWVLTGDWPGQAAPDVGHGVKCWPMGDRLCFFNIQRRRITSPPPLLISMPRAC